MQEDADDIEGNIVDTWEAACAGGAHRGSAGSATPVDGQCEAAGEVPWDGTAGGPADETWMAEDAADADLYDRSFGHNPDELREAGQEPGGATAA
eukprot:7454185-Heterocapsa_arctica.AAC.1